MWISLRTPLRDVGQCVEHSRHTVDLGRLVGADVGGDLKQQPVASGAGRVDQGAHHGERAPMVFDRSEVRTSELRSPMYLVCRLLLEKKNKTSAVAGMPSQPNLFYIAQVN